MAHALMFQERLEQKRLKSARAFFLSALVSRDAFASFALATIQLFAGAER